VPEPVAVNLQIPGTDSGFLLKVYPMGFLG